MTPRKLNPLTIPENYALLLKKQPEPGMTEREMLDSMSRHNLALANMARATRAGRKRRADRGMEL